jgi:hypothetical protein
MNFASRKPISLVVRGLFVSAVVLGMSACGVATEDLASEESGMTSSEFRAGPCAGTPLDAAVKCAVKKGASVLSYYRDPKDQERVRKENGCRDRCTGGAGCVRPTAGCTTSPHTRCTAVDLNRDGAPLSRQSLRACGLAKTKAPHANHYDLVGAPSGAAAEAPEKKTKKATSKPIEEEEDTVDGDDDDEDEDTASAPPSSSGGRCNREGGLYCGNQRTALKGDPRKLYECVGGAMKLYEDCASGCQVNGTGIDDECGE